MHGHNYIEWLLLWPFDDVQQPLSEEYDRLFIDSPWYIPDHDALGIVLMGGEL